MSSEDSYMIRLKTALVGREMTAINDSTMLIATSRGDIVRIAPYGSSFDMTGIAVMVRNRPEYLGRTVCNARFTSTLLATLSGAKRWSVSLDVQFDDSASGGWYSLAASSVKSLSGQPGQTPPEWMHEVSVMSGRAILILAQKDAESTV